MGAGGGRAHTRVWHGREVPAGFGAAWCFDRRRALRVRPVVVEAAGAAVLVAGMCLVRSRWRHLSSLRCERPRAVAVGWCEVEWRR